MSARQLSGLDAIAFRLAALLEQYELDLEEMTSRWLDPALHARVCEELAELRLLCAASPELSVSWVHLLISHTELMHRMWTGAADATAAHPVERSKSEHLLAVRALREKCLRHFTRGDAIC